MGLANVYATAEAVGEVFQIKWGDLVKKIHECIHKVVHDVISMPAELKTLAREKGAEGYQVERGALGTVILKLSDGEVHYVPAGGCIKMFAFSRMGKK